MPERCRLRPEQLREHCSGAAGAVRIVASWTRGRRVRAVLPELLHWTACTGVRRGRLRTPLGTREGVGARLWRHLAQVVLDNGYSRLECVTLHSNTLGMDVHPRWAPPDGRLAVLRWDGERCARSPAGESDNLIP